MAKTLPQILNEYQESNNLTPQKLADILGISRTTLINYKKEDYPYPPKGEKLQNICDKLGILVDDVDVGHDKRDESAETADINEQAEPQVKWLEIPEGTRIRYYDANVNPLDYPEYEVRKHRVALLKCIEDRLYSSIATSRLITLPQKGCYYLALCYYNIFSFPDFQSPPEYRVCLVAKDGMEGKHFPGEYFEIIYDPYDIMNPLAGVRYAWFNTLMWRYNKAMLRDKSSQIVSDEYLINHRLALVQYHSPDNKPLRWHGVTIEDSQQCFVVTHVPDLTPGVWMDIIGTNSEGKECIIKERPDRFDIVSDPLRLLDWRLTDWQENIRLQKELRPDLYLMD